MRFLLIGCLFACDFSPKLHKEIFKAQDMVSRGDYKNATGLYEKILTMNMEDDLQVKVLYQLADINSIFLGDVKKGQKYYLKVLDFTRELSEQIKAYDRLGEINFTYLKNYKEALGFYYRLKEISQVDRDFVELRIALCYLNIGDYEKAYDELEKISQNPFHKHKVIAYYFLGLIHFRKSEWELSIKQWVKYLEVEKRRDKIVEVRYLMANAYETMENLKEAYALYYSLLGEYPNTEVIQNRLRAVYLRKVSRKR